MRFPSRWQFSSDKESCICLTVMLNLTDNDDSNTPTTLNCLDPVWLKLKPVLSCFDLDIDNGEQSQGNGDHTHLLSIVKWCELSSDGLEQMNLSIFIFSLFQCCYFVQLRYKNYYWFYNISIQRFYLSTLWKSVFGFTIQKQTTLI